ncbi:HAMP domain-containing sensor histidine kinase [Streptomyces sp. NPDC093544]|uniref:HAMP domain-containing sensor histidine kinase n=1 Tax=Streptomyces sp. NPDC093544 TaxID=3155200 RepID=UPI0034470D49
MRLPLPRSLRSQITASVALLVVLVVGVAGLVIVDRIDHRDRTDVDRQLTARADKVQGDADKLLSQGNGADSPGSDDYGGLLVGSQSLVRLVSGNEIITQRGDQPTAAIPVPTSDGLSTVRVGGQSWRSFVQPLRDDSDARLQVLQDLGPIEQRLADNTRIVAGVAVLSMFIAAGGVWLITRMILQPLQRLRTGAHRIRAADTHQQLPTVTRPQEVADLSASLNRMLGQLQTSMHATRRFTADAGHELRTPLTTIGMNLETLQRNPHLPAAQRQEALDAMVMEHRRITVLLEGLQILARGDAGALPPRATVDLPALLDETVRHAQHRHPATTYNISIAAGSVPRVQGWPAGLRMAVDNLLNNAALHGRQPHGQVHVSLVWDSSQVYVSVIDDGPGIPSDQREAVKERFARGRRPRSHGSGLGLALVQQQAELHGGTLTLGDAAGGGLQATLTIQLYPIAGSSTHTTRPTHSHRG